MTLSDWGFVVLVAAVFVLGVIVVSDHLEQKRRSKKEKEAKSQPAAPNLLPLGLEPEVKAEAVREAEPAPAETEEPGPVRRFRDRLEALTAQGESVESAFSRAFEEAAGGLGFDEALGEAADMNYKLTDLAALMVKRNHSLADGADFLNEHGDLGLGELIAALAGFAVGNSPKEKAAAILEAVKSVHDLDDEGEQLKESLGALGCSPEEIAEFLFRWTSMGLGEAILATELWKSPETAAHLAKELEVDISDSEEYRALREGDIEFESAAAVLKARGSNAAEVLNAENGYDELELDEMKDVLGTLSKVGFSKQEALDGIWHSDFTDNSNSGAVVAALQEAEVPVADIVGLLAKEEVDPEDLYSELSEENVDVRDRIEILHSLFEAIDREKEPA